MPVIDDRTPGINLPLPNQDNSLEDDVLRLREAFTAIDAVLASDEPLLASVQAIVDAIKATDTALDDHVGGGGVARHMAATESTAGFMSSADKAKLNDVSLGLVFETVGIVPASNGQTAFTVAGGYEVGSIMVFLNGVKLEVGDFTATTSPDLVLAVGADTVDKLEVVRFRLALRQ